MTQHVVLQVHIHGAGERIRHHERRRSEEVHLHFRMHAAFEVAIAGEHRGGDDIAGLDARGNFRLQRAGIADAGGAAVADDIEADGLERG